MTYADLLNKIENAAKHNPSILKQNISIYVPDMQELYSASECMQESHLSSDIREYTDGVVDPDQMVIII